MTNEKTYSEELMSKVEQFFKIRFPEKNIEFEKKCGYFWEWCERFQNYTMYRYADEESKQALNEVL